MSIQYASYLAYGRSGLQTFSWPYVCVLTLVLLQPCSPPRLSQAATAFGLVPSYGLLRVVTTAGPSPLDYSHLIPSPFTYHRLVAYSSDGARCLVHVASFILVAGGSCVILAVAEVFVSSLHRTSSLLSCIVKLLALDCCISFCCLPCCPPLRLGCELA